jgi:polyhydroxyalkanoate synthesis regulator phasin
MDKQVFSNYRRCDMRNTLFLASLLCFTITLNAQDKDLAKEKLNYGKEKVNSGKTVVKETNISAKEVREKVKDGTITKDEGKAAVKELRQIKRSSK